MKFYPKKLSHAYQQEKGLTANRLAQSISNAQERVQNMWRHEVEERLSNHYSCTTHRASLGVARNPKTDRLHQPVFLLDKRTDAVSSLLEN